MALNKTKFSEVSAQPPDGGILLTDAADETAGFKNYTVKENLRRITFDQESTREGDVYFQPNQLIESGTQAFPPIENGQPITLVHDAIFPNGQIFTILGTPTDIFVYVALDGFTVYEIGPFIIEIDNLANALKIKGNWAAEFPEGKEIRILRSVYNNGKYTIGTGGATYTGGTTDETTIPIDEPIPFAVPDGVIVAPVYGNAITAVDTLGDRFSIDGDHTGAFLDTNTFYVIGSTGNDQKYTVSGGASFAGGKTVIPVLDEIPGGAVDGFILPVYDITPSWLKIAADLEPGHRWEVFNMNNLVVFNNGVELPFTWERGASQVVPIHELRDQGVGAVETITEYNGMLLCADILEIPESDLVDFMNGSDPYGHFDNELAGNRIRYKILYSPIGQPRRWGALVLGTMAATSNTIDLQFVPADWKAGTGLTVSGAGTLGGNLEATITSIVGNTVTLSAPSVGAVTDAAVVQTSDRELSPFPGSSYELQGDNTGIVRMMTMKTTLVVYKDKSILIGRFNGDPEDPIDFSPVYEGDNVPFWRWTLAQLSDQEHIYCSKDNFYKFSLATLVPQLVEKPALCRDLFFNNENVTLENAELIYASNNEMTDEIWFHFPGDALAYDYKYDTCAIVGREYTGAKTIMRPREATSLRSEERWYVGGRADGTALLYALVNLVQPATGNTYKQYGVGGKYTNFVGLYQNGNTVYSDGEFFIDKDVGSTIVWDDGLIKAKIIKFIDGFSVEVDVWQEVPPGKAYVWEKLYNAKLESGWNHLGSVAGDKDLESYSIDLGEDSGDPDTQVQLYANNRAKGDGELIVDEILDEICEYSMIPLLLRDRFFKESITLTDQIEPLIFVSRNFNAKLVDNRRITSI